MGKQDDAKEEANCRLMAAVLAGDAREAAAALAAGADTACEEYEAKRRDVRPLANSRPALLAALLAACGCTALNKAAFKGDLARMRNLLEKGAPIDRCSSCTWQGPDGVSALGCAVHQGRSDVVRELLARGANPNACGGRALFWAVVSGDPRLVRTLLDAGAAANDVDTLFEALPHPAIVQMLVDAGADPRLEFIGAHTRGTILAIARNRSSPEVVRILERAVDPVARAQRAVEKSYADRRAEIEAQEREGDVQAKKDRAAGAVAAYLSAYRACPDGVEAKERLFTKLVDAARLSSPSLSIPAQAQEHADRAHAFVRLAKDQRGFKKAADEFEAAAELAPWWAEAHYNLGLAREKAGDPRRAAESLKRFLKASPQAPEVAAVNQKIIELQVAQELR